MTTHPPYSVVLSFAGDHFDVQAVDQKRIATAIAGALNMPILMDDFDYKLDDEFARRLGVAVLNLIALGQPEIKPFISVTQDSGG
ncbi:hypothetical protein WM04_06940 [Burkholderia ubonensis]|uniref:hypothetical protein n=1 Tax=Burkholderia ubonensis TaxID=101571 RepID=UPI0007566E42|nr:hypothetical protein [Burkholderia ubonensis]KWI36366.1 hypothetical protein WM04_06940 [Burkholderia ubonensis]OJB15540.1 hypothetical protein BGV53_20160 [Burkholderia ubonensis]